MKIKLMKGDCLTEMKKLRTGSVDMVMCDPPYGSQTDCKWDTIIPLEPMWEQLNRLVKEKGAIVLTCTQPFTSRLVSSNFEGFAFEWVWDKVLHANYANAKRTPLKTHENVVVFTTTGVQPNYYPQMTDRLRKVYSTRKKGKAQEQLRNRSRKENHLNVNTKKDMTFEYTQKYPQSQITFEATREGHHPTQKPVELMEYLIKTYTQPGETVLDFCMGSGSTGVACANTNRNFIGIELTDEYYETASKRIKRAKSEQRFFKE